MAWTARNLPRDLWYDEIFTLYEFAARPVGEIVRDYSAPNNHVAFTLLVKPWLSVTSSEWALRLPSMAAALAALLGVYYAGLRWRGRDAAVLATGALALCQMFQNFAVEVRGYALSMALVAGLAAAVVSRAGHARNTAIALASAAAIYTIPTNVLLVAALAMASGLRALIAARHEFPRSAVAAPLVRAAAPWLIGLALAAVLYAPMGEGLLAARDAMERPPVSWGADRMAAFARAALADQWPLAIAAAIGWIVWARGAWRPRVAGLAALVLCGMGPFLAAGMLRLPLYTRLFSPMLPLVALALGGGLAHLGRRLLPGRWVAPLGLALIYAVSAPRLATYDARSARAVAVDPRVQDGYYHFYAADFRPHDVVRWLNAARPQEGSYAIAFAPVDHYHLQYYLFEEQLPENNVVPRGPGTYRGTLFLVGPEPPDYEAIARHYRFNADELRRFPRVGRVGYFSIYRSPPEFELTVHP